VLPEWVVALVGTSVLALAVLACSNDKVVGSDGATCDLSDGTLRLEIPCAWSDSLNPGFERNQPAAWLIAGNFRFPGGWSSTSKGTPRVPKRGALIVIGNFPLASRPAARNWPLVTQLDLPSARLVGRETSWQVRFKGRALLLTVVFGPQASGETVRLVDKALASAKAEDGSPSRSGLVLTVRRQSVSLLSQPRLARAKAYPPTAPELGFDRSDAGNN
jgi:hypothetical protein